jgi:tRNA-2-methylthio-N6-dimethylallyladenosine synthase
MILFLTTGVINRTEAIIIAPMMKYHIWTEGCQMNVADSRRVSAELENLGYEHVSRPDEADVIILNTCVVRQSAEDKALGRLSSLKPLKKNRPELVINLMGCLVGNKVDEDLKKRLPYVDVFSAPSDPGPLLDFLARRDGRQFENKDTNQRFAIMDQDLALPYSEQGRVTASFIPVVYGCSFACTYCIIPYRRGAEKSRHPEEILAEAKALADQGVKEVTLLGQIVDRYGLDEPGNPSLAGLLRQMHDIKGIERLRFLTSHPNWMSDELLDTVADLPKVMPHIEIPAQAGDDEILDKMKRGYTSDEYRRLIAHIRDRVPGVSIATDIIVGFPGESEAQFLRSYNLMAELKLDVAHLARYSPRSGTVAARRLADDVPDEEKWRRFRLLEDLQEKISADIHARYIGRTVEVLFEEKVKLRWKGRTPTNKLVFVETESDLWGMIKVVRINWTGPWSMIGDLA